jgi:putative spermidine/putrescine transport system permease protein
MRLKKRGQSDWTSVLAIIVVIIGLLFLVFPIIVVIAASFNKSAYIQFPPQSFSLRWYINILSRYKFIDGFQISVIIASIVTLISTFCGILASLALVRYNFRGKNLLNSYFLSPIILPEVVTGVCLLILFSNIGMFNNMFNMIIAHIIITIPYVIRTVSAVLYRFDRSIEEAAMNLGANPVQTFFKVTFPLIKTGVVAGALFSFIMSFDNFAVSIFLSGPRTETLPIVIFMHLRYEVDPTLAAVCTLLIAGIVAIVFFLERFISLEQFAGID